MRNTKSKIIIVMCIALCLMVVGYAAFSTSLSITGTSNIASQWNVVFTKIEEASKTSGVTIINTPTASGTSATFNVGLALPGDKIVYRITIENKGTLDAKVQNISASATDSPAIIFNMSGIKIGEEIKKQTTKTFEVTIEYNPATTSQPDITNKTLTVNITVVQSAGSSSSTTTPSINQPLYLSSAIFRDNAAYADTNIDFKYSSEGCYYDSSSRSSVCDDSKATNGLYYTNTNTENNLTTYYFRGAVENNYVQFGKYNSEIYHGYYNSTNLTDYMAFDNLNSCQNAEEYNVNCTKIRSVGDSILWRIVRINEDGSIRIVTQDAVVGSAFNTKYGDNAYVGYMYGTRGSSSTYAATHTNTKDSTIKGVIDTWYESNLSSYASYLADAGFCNDRSIAPSAGLWYSSDTALGYSNKETYYGSFNRLRNNKKPQFACPNESRDLFTTSTSSKGNKALTNPIGLLTADEVEYAGAAYVVGNSNYYLYTGNYYWTMSPYYYFSLSANVQFVLSGGNTQGSIVDGESNVRPVVNLQSGVEITGGNGTSTNPYIIKTN